LPFRPWHPDPGIRVQLRDALNGAPIRNIDLN
jgi:hypothetical protein